MTGMQRRLVFGTDRDPGVVDELVELTRGGQRKSNPMILAVGRGGEGTICGTCSHLYRVGGVAGRYYKCDLRRVSSGPATDHRVRWPACAEWSRRSER